MPTLYYSPSLYTREVESSKKRSLVIGTGTSYACFSPNKSTLH